MLVLKVEFLNLKKEATISNNELIRGISVCLDDSEKLSLAIQVLNSIDKKKIDPGQLMAFKTWLKEQKTYIELICPTKRRKKK